VRIVPSEFLNLMWEDITEKLARIFPRLHRKKEKYGKPKRTNASELGGRM